MKDKSSTLLILLLITFAFSTLIIFTNNKQKQDYTKEKSNKRITSSVSLDPPSLPKDFSWTPIPENEVKTNKNALHWSIDLRECSGKTKDTCKYPDRYYRPNSTIPGDEWISQRIVNNREEEGIYTYSNLSIIIREIAKEKKWTIYETEIMPGYTLGSSQGAQSATYQPTCIYGLSDNNVRVACITRIVPKESTKGEGLLINYIYPYREEIRFFISDIVNVSSLINQLDL